jgi:hypothetical protein
MDTIKGMTSYLYRQGIRVFDIPALTHPETA